METQAEGQITLEGTDFFEKLGKWRSFSLLNKSMATNVFSFFLTGLGFFSPWYPELLKSVGLFALSGAITNWLAIHMLFERVPGLYGSGVIPARFEEFKVEIRKLIMEQFFTGEQIKSFFSSSHFRKEEKMNLEPVVEALDYELIFSKLVEAVKESPFSGMLALVGGVKVLQPVKGPFIAKLRESLVEISEQEEFQEKLRQGLKGSFNFDTLQESIAIIVQTRLEELTPDLVKQIMQEMIHKHLGWLVVWGGVFGGGIGFLAYVFS